jgi:hypothetical protein
MTVARENRRSERNRERRERRKLKPSLKTVRIRKIYRHSLREKRGRP